jgi:cellulose synthase/poly-beta-1,6-N-acetylglucosamine synthase-like glycosyltransferase
MMWLLQNRSSLLSRLDVYVPIVLISVIIPCYNQRKYISNTITSVIQQTWQLWEIIVIDDGI